MAEVEYWQEPDRVTHGDTGDETFKGPWHWHVRFTNGRISGHDYNDRAAAVEGFHAHNTAVFEIMKQVVRDVNERNGWFEADRTFGEDVALLHSEVSEALEEFRDGRVGRYYADHSAGEDIVVHVPDGKDYPDGKKPIGVPSELADVLIRLLDTCDRYGVDLYREWHAKVKFNATRGHRHGNKAL